jgi:hypothetical protein
MNECSGNEAETAVPDPNAKLWNAQAIASCGRAVEISQELFYLTKAMVLNNDNHEHAYGGTNGCFTRLRVLLVLQAPRHCGLI